jgi:hypothetical protein
MMLPQDQVKDLHCPAAEEFYQDLWAMLKML